MAEEVAQDRKKSRPKLRPWVRAIHRDIGYLAVGLTIVYAMSGIAVNHVADYKDGDASYVKYTRTSEVGPIPKEGRSENELGKAVLSRMNISGEAKEAFLRSENELEVSVEKRTLVVDLATGHVFEEGQKPRFFLKFANWLHLNRGKKAWTYVADAYAGGLLFLAFSGLFMIPGRKGFVGRGVVLALVGAAIPAVYVALAGHG